MMPRDKEATMADREGMFTTLGKTLDESMSMMADFRSGKLTRREFDRWYEQKRRSGLDMAFKVRDRTAGLRQPLELVFEIGKGFMTGPASPPYRRRSRRRGRPSARRGARR